MLKRVSPAAGRARRTSQHVHDAASPCRRLRQARNHQLSPQTSPRDLLESAPEDSPARLPATSELGVLLNRGVPPEDSARLPSTSALQFEEQAAKDVLPSERGEAGLLGTKVSKAGPAGPRPGPARTAATVVAPADGVEGIAGRDPKSVGAFLSCRPQFAAGAPTKSLGGRAPKAAAEPVARAFQAQMLLPGSMQASQRLGVSTTKLVERLEELQVAFVREQADALAALRDECCLLEAELAHYRAKAGTDNPIPEFRRVEPSSSTRPEFVIAGAAGLGLQTNGTYAAVGRHEDRLVYKRTGGSEIIYYKNFWKISAGPDMNSWLYWVDGDDREPPVGHWLHADAILNSAADPPPLVRKMDDLEAEAHLVAQQASEAEFVLELGETEGEAVAPSCGVESANTFKGQDWPVARTCVPTLLSSIAESVIACEGHRASFARRCEVVPERAFVVNTRRFAAMNAAFDFMHALVTSAVISALALVAAGTWTQFVNTFVFLLGVLFLAMDHHWAYARLRPGGSFQTLANSYGAEPAQEGPNQTLRSLSVKMSRLPEIVSRIFYGLYGWALVGLWIATVHRFTEDDAAHRLYFDAMGDLEAAAMQGVVLSLMYGLCLGFRFMLSYETQGCMPLNEDGGVWDVRVHGLPRRFKMFGLPSMWFSSEYAKEHMRCCLDASVADASVLDFYPEELAAALARVPGGAYGVSKDVVVAMLRHARFDDGKGNALNIDLCLFARDVRHPGMPHAGDFFFGSDDVDASVER